MLYTVETTNDKFFRVISHFTLADPTYKYTEGRSNKIIIISFFKTDFKTRLNSLFDIFYRSESRDS